jgi:hypothetical protein
MKNLNEHVNRMRQLINAKHGVIKNIVNESEETKESFFGGIGKKLKDTFRSYDDFEDNSKMELEDWFSNVSSELNLPDSTFEETTYVDLGSGFRSELLSNKIYDIYMSTKDSGGYDQFKTEIDNLYTKYGLNKKLTESDITRIAKRVISENKKKISDEDIEKELIMLANAERFLVKRNKPSNPKNTDEVTYTDLSDTSIKDDFTKYYDDMKKYMKDNDEEVTLVDHQNKKKFKFKLTGNKLKATKL